MNDRKQFPIIWDQSIARTQYVQPEVKDLIRDLLQGVNLSTTATGLGRLVKDLNFTIDHPAGYNLAEKVDLLDHLVISISGYGGSGEKAAQLLFPPAGKRFRWSVVHFKMAGYLIGWPEWACDSEGMVVEAYVNISLVDS